MRFVTHLAVAVLLGLVLTLLPAALQHSFKAGSIPDLICEFMLLPGSMFATLFRDRGTASPEFLWRSWIFTAVLFSAMFYFLIPKRRGA
jgi:hypothetical protein